MRVNTHFSQYLETLAKVKGLTTALHVHYAFCTFLCRHCTTTRTTTRYNVKVPNFTVCGGRKHKTTTLFFFPVIRYILKNSTPEKVS